MVSPLNNDPRLIKDAILNYTDDDDEEEGWTKIMKKVHHWRASMRVQKKPQHHVKQHYKRKASRKSSKAEPQAGICSNNHLEDLQKHQATSKNCHSKIKQAGQSALRMSKSYKDALKTMQLEFAGMVTTRSARERSRTDSRRKGGARRICNDSHGCHGLQLQAR
jgi:hypothetical protein